MLTLLLLWLITAGSLLLLSHYVPGIVVPNATTAMIAGLVMGLINSLIKPVAEFITLPLNFLSFGLFSFVLNALLFWLAATLVDGFSISGFWPALIGSVALTFVYGLFDAIFTKD